MNKVVEFLKENPVQYLATVGRDGKAKCRPFMFAMEQDGKLWFCTNNQKVYTRICRQIRKLKFPFPVLPMPGSVSTAKLCLKTICPSKRAACSIPS